MLTDIRYALRLLARSPLFTATSVLSVAIGIAAATVIVELADALLWRASPGIRDASRVVDIARTTNGRGFGTMSYPAFRYLREQTQSLEAMAATTLSPVPMSLRDAGVAAADGRAAAVDGDGDGDGMTSQRVYGRTVSANFFDVLRVRPAMGRFFRGDEDEVADARPVAVLSHRFWRDRFRSDAGVLDRAISLNGVAFTVIGVAEAGFENTTFVGTDLWIPMMMAAAVRAPAEPAAELFANPRSTWHMAIGRLKPGVTVEAAQAELNARFDAFKATVTPAVPAAHGILAVRSGRVPPPVRLPFSAFAGLLFVLTTGLLAIACSNVAGMLLARSAARQREMATRLAIGASRRRLLGQMLIETLVLFGAAGLAALPIALWLTSALQAFVPALPMPVALELSLSVRGLTFAGGVSLLAGLIFGLAPARQALRPDVARMLHGQTSTAGRDRLRLRQGLVVAQIALALAVTITAGLFVRTLLAAARIDSGFRTANVDVITLDTSLADATGLRAVPLMQRVVDRIRAIGGVESAGHARMIPLEGGSFAIGRVRVPGASDAALAHLNDDNWDVVSPDYFRSVGLPVVDGRAFSDDDREGRPLVAIVNESFARIAWPGRSAIGQRVWQVQGGDRGESSRAERKRRTPAGNRRRRQRREIPHDWRIAARVHLRAVRAAAADARRVVRQTRGWTLDRTRRPRGDRKYRARPADRSRAVVRGCRGDRHVPAAPRGVGGRVRRRDRRVPRGPWALRPGRVPRHAADARNRHPHGARRHASRRARDGPVAGGSTGSRRVARRRAARSGAWTRDAERESAARRDTNGSRNADRHVRDDARGPVRRNVDARAARNVDRSGIGAARRVSIGR